MGAYVYCVARATHPLPLRGAWGVGAEACPLRAVRARSLAAVVSDAPAGLRAKRRDLAAHQSVIERLHVAGAVLPMRFGVVAENDEAVRAELAAGAERYVALLSRVDGQVELNVKGTHREDAVLRDLLLANRELRARHEALRAAGGGSHQGRLELGERIAAALEDRRARDADHLIAGLRPHASDVRRGPPVDGCFVNVSFLVPFGAQGRLEAAYRRVRRQLAEHASVELYGPLPPYSFVAGESGA